MQFRFLGYILAAVLLSLLLSAVPAPFVNRESATAVKMEQVNKYKNRKVIDIIVSVLKDQQFESTNPDQDKVIKEAKQHRVTEASCQKTGRFYVNSTIICHPDGYEFVPMGGNFALYRHKELLNHLDSFINDWKLNSVRIYAVVRGFRPDVHNWSGYIPGKSKRNMMITTNRFHEAMKTIDEITKRKVVVMIDAHSWTCTGVNNTDNPIYTKDGKLVGQNRGYKLPWSLAYTNKSKFSSQQEVLEEYWKFMARRFKDNPYVWFNLNNEPGHPFGFLRDKDGKHLKKLPDYWLHSHKKLIEVVREQGAKNIIVIDEGNACANGPAYDWNPPKKLHPKLSTILTYGPQLLENGQSQWKDIVFSVHTYGVWGGEHSEKVLSDFVDAIHQKGYPLVFGESGVPISGDKSTSKRKRALTTSLAVALDKKVGFFIWELAGRSGFHITNKGPFWERDSGLTFQGKAFWNEVKNGKFAIK